METDVGVEFQKEQHVQRLGGKRDQETSEKLKAVPTNIKWPYRNGFISMMCQHHFKLV